MRLSFRLAEIHKYTPDLRRRPGIIKTICDRTGLDRHQVAALLRNEVKHIPLDALSKLCDYLIEQRLAPADSLPGALFAVEAEHFWELLARRRRLELCLGVRRGDTVNWPDGEWVVASDSVLMGELLSGMSTLGRAVPIGATIALPADVAGGPSPPTTRLPPLHPESLKQSLVLSPTPGALDDGVGRSRVAYEEFGRSEGDKALVCVGSMKSNPVAELVIASAFNLTPFESQDDRGEPAQRGCPLYVRYRPTDPYPTSCWGGLRLSRWEATDEPGIYYERPGGQWMRCPSDAAGNDAAYVFYIYRESQGWLEMALGGFSGRATRQLARTLTTRAEAFWPPIDCGLGVKAGAFVVRYKFSTESDVGRTALGTDYADETEVIALDPKVLQRRLNPAKAKSKRSSGVKAR